MNEPDPGHLVQPEREAAFGGREGVGQDRAGIGHQHGPADPLQDPHHDQPPGAARAVQVLDPD
jgi:hypothetical protein